MASASGEATLLRLADVESLGFRALRTRRIRWERTERRLVRLQRWLAASAPAVVLVLVLVDVQVAVHAVAAGVVALLAAVTGQGVCQVKMLQVGNDEVVLRAGVKAAGGMARLHADAYRYRSRFPPRFDRKVARVMRLAPDAAEIAAVLADDGFDGSLRDLAATARTLAA